MHHVSQTDKVTSGKDAQNLEVIGKDQKILRALHRFHASSVASTPHLLHQHVWFNAMAMSEQQQQAWVELGRGAYEPHF